MIHYKKNGVDVPLNQIVGGAVHTVNGMTGHVVLNMANINDVDINNLADGQVLAYDSTSSKFKNVAQSGGTSDYTDLTNKPQINGVTLSGNKTSGDLGIAYSNPNLLDNAWFTVNQKGFTSATYNSGGDYPILDRYKVYRGNDTPTTFELLSNGLRIWTTNSTSQYIADTFRQTLIRQPMESNVNLIGKTVTMSALLSNGRVYSVTKQIEDDTYNGDTILIDDTIPLSLYFAFNTRHNTIYENSFVFGFQTNMDEYTSGELQIIVRAVKLELGTESTLALDTAPNYTTELLKCQRYYYRITALSSYTVVGQGSGFSTNQDILIPIKLPTEMRTTPTLSCVGSFNANGSNILSGINMSLLKYAKDIVNVLVTSSSTINDSIYQLQINGQGDYIEFNAEL